MSEPTNRLASWLDRIDHLPVQAQKCARDLVIKHVFFGFETDADLKRMRGEYRRQRKIKTYGAEHCARMVEIIEGYLALREMGIVTYERPRGRRRKSN